MEEFRDIPGYEGLYQVSNLGRVKSLGNNQKRKEKILNPRVSTWGYNQVLLSKNKIIKNNLVHKLVAMAFLNHIPCGHKIVVDHINDNKLDNRLENLQLISQRENVFKTQGKYSSKYKGVCLHKKLNKWVSNIQINGINIYLGLFNCELAAHQAYQNKLKEIS
jgi:hypothetical protein